MSNLPTGRPGRLELGLLLAAIAMITLISVAFLGPIVTPIVST